MKLFLELVISYNSYHVHNNKGGFKGFFLARQLRVGQIESSSKINIDGLSNGNNFKTEGYDIGCNKNHAQWNLIVDQLWQDVARGKSLLESCGTTFLPTDSHP